MPVVYAGPVVTGGLTTYFGHDDGNLTTPEAVRAPLPWTQHDAAKAAFLAATSANDDNDLETFTELDNSPFVLTFSGFGTATITSAGGGFMNQITAPATNGTGRYPTSGEYYYDTRDADEVAFADLDINAFGFSAIDVGDFAGQVQLTINYVDLTSEVYEPPHMIGSAGASPVAGSIAFIGVVATKAIASVVLGNSSGGFDVFGFDDFISAQVTIVVVVPPGIPGVPADCAHPLAVQPCPPSHCAIVVSVTPVAYSAGTVAVLSVPAACGHPLSMTPCPTSAGSV